MKQAENQGLYGQGKSGKLAVVRGKIAFSFCRSGKSFIFHHQRNMYNTLITWLLHLLFRMKMIALTSTFQ